MLVKGNKVFAKWQKLTNEHKDWENDLTNNNFNQKIFMSWDFYVSSTSTYTWHEHIFSCHNQANISQCKTVESWFFLI